MYIIYKFTPAILRILLNVPAFTYRLFALKIFPMYWWWMPAGKFS